MICLNNMKVLHQTKCSQDQERCLLKVELAVSFLFHNGVTQLPTSQTLTNTPTQLVSNTTTCYQPNISRLKSTTGVPPAISPVVPLRNSFSNLAIIQNVFPISTPTISSFLQKFILGYRSTSDHFPLFPSCLVCSFPPPPSQSLRTSAKWL